MSNLIQLQEQFINIREKTRSGEIFQSLGDKIASVLNDAERDALTDIQLPQNGEAALEIIKRYNRQSESSNTDHQNIYNVDMISDNDLLIVVQQLANPLPKFRDTGAFFFISDVIQNDLITEKQMHWLMAYLIDDTRLFGHIFEPNNDAIYQRSFAILVISLLLFTHRTRKSFLTVNELDHVINKVALYAALERDTRGFIGTNGWAHAFTHIANAIAELLMFPHLMRADKLFLLASMLAGYRELQQPLMMGETERIVEVTNFSANKHAVYHDYVLLTLKLWRKDLVTRKPPQDEGRWHQMYNRTRFFNTLMLRGRDDVPEKIYAYIEQTRDFLT
ncbi:DUF2785 domain-containing protein [Leuconostoc palmae]|uniref:DUF2785 domain-containing protein n=1 Tax=Leuconostoc palmae TaxID=501487 RepID=UPI001C7CFAC8|nr:DUF2785 domain-containing protein [Leuconostoc palmae]